MANLPRNPISGNPLQPQGVVDMRRIVPTLESMTRDSRQLQLVSAGAKEITDNAYQQLEIERRVQAQNDAAAYRFQKDANGIPLLPALDDQTSVYGNAYSVMMKQRYLDEVRVTAGAKLSEIHQSALTEPEKYAELSQAYVDTMLSVMPEDVRGLVESTIKADQQQHLTNIHETLAKADWETGQKLQQQQMSETIDKAAIAFATGDSMYSTYEAQIWQSFDAAVKLGYMSPKAREAVEDQLGMMKVFQSLNVEFRNKSPEQLLAVTQAIQEGKGAKGWRKEWDDLPYDQLVQVAGALEGIANSQNRLDNINEANAAKALQAKWLADFAVQAEVAATTGNWGNLPSDPQKQLDYALQIGKEYGNEYLIKTLNYFQALNSSFASRAGTLTDTEQKVWAHISNTQTVFAGGAGSGPGNFAERATPPGIMRYGQSEAARNAMDRFFPNLFQMPVEQQTGIYQGYGQISTIQRQAILDGAVNVNSNTAFGLAMWRAGNASSLARSHLAEDFGDSAGFYEALDKYVGLGQEPTADQIRMAKDVTRLNAQAPRDVADRFGAENVAELHEQIDPFIGEALGGLGAWETLGPVVSTFAPVSPQMLAKMGTPGGLSAEYVESLGRANMPTLDTFLSINDRNAIRSTTLALLERAGGELTDSKLRIATQQATKMVLGNKTLDIYSGPSATNRDATMVGETPAIYLPTGETLTGATPGISQDARAELYRDFVMNNSVIKEDWYPLMSQAARDAYASGDLGQLGRLFKFYQTSGYDIVDGQPFARFNLMVMQNGAWLYTPIRVDYAEDYLAALSKANAESQAERDKAMSEGADYVNQKNLPIVPLLGSPAPENKE